MLIYFRENLKKTKYCRHKNNLSTFVPLAKSPHIPLSFIFLTEENSFPKHMSSSWPKKRKFNQNNSTNHSTSCYNTILICYKPLLSCVSSWRISHVPGSAPPPKVASSCVVRLVLPVPSSVLDWTPPAWNRVSALIDHVPVLLGICPPYFAQRELPRC